MVDVPVDGTVGRFHLKRYHYPDWSKSKGLLGRGTGWGMAPELREFKNLEFLREKGVSAVRPVAAAALTKSGRLVRHALLTEHIPDTIDLAKRLATRGDPVRDDPPTRRRVAELLGRLVHRMHMEAFTHRDLHARNVLVRVDEDGPVACGPATAAGAARRRSAGSTSTTSRRSTSTSTAGVAARGPARRLPGVRRAGRGRRGLGGRGRGALGPPRESGPEVALAALPRRLGGAGRGDVGPRRYRPDMSFSLRSLSARRYRIEGDMPSVHDADFTRRLLERRFEPLSAHEERAFGWVTADNCLDARFETGLDGPRALRRLLAAHRQAPRQLPPAPRDDGPRAARDAARTPTPRRKAPRGRRSRAAASRATSGPSSARRSPRSSCATRARRWRCTPCSSTPASAWCCSARSRSRPTRRSARCSATRSTCPCRRSRRTTAASSCCRGRAAARRSRRCVAASSAAAGLTASEVPEALRQRAKGLIADVAVHLRRRPGRPPMIRAKDRPVDERGGMDWLGPEFLTWLWWRASVAPEFRSAEGSSLYVHVDEFLELKGERAAARKTSLRSGMPAASAEGKVALRNGKVVTAARLLFVRGEEETSLHPARGRPRRLRRAAPRARRRGSRGAARVVAGRRPPPVRRPRPLLRDVPRGALLRPLGGRDRVASRLGRRPERRGEPECQGADGERVGDDPVRDGRRGVARLRSRAVPPLCPSTSACWALGGRRVLCGGARLRPRAPPRGLVRAGGGGRRCAGARQRAASPPLGTTRSSRRSLCWRPR